MMARDQKIREILDAAVKTFLRFGFKKTTLEDVADSLGMTKSSLYHYFSSKDALLLEALRKIFSDNLEEYRRTFGNENPLIESYIKMSEQFIIASKTYFPSSYDVVLEFSDFMPVLIPDFKLFTDSLLDIMDSRLEYEVSQGRLRPLPIRELNQIIVLLVRNNMIRSHHKEAATMFDEGLEHYIRILFDPYMIDRAAQQDNKKV